MRPAACGLGKLVFALSRAAAADVPAQPIEPPSGFHLQLSGRLEQVVYAESVGEFHNAVDRHAIERQCETARQLGLTDKRPAFEPGHDQPLRTESRRYSSSRRWANYRTVHAYECSAPSAASEPRAIDSPCACTYRRQVRRSVQVKKWEPGRYETLVVDLGAGTATRTVVTAGAVRTPEQDAEKISLLAPEVIGHDVVAGLRCVVRRQHLGTDGWTDRCLTTNDPALPAPLRWQTLWEFTPSRDGKGVHSQERVVRVLTKAQVDAAIFDLPEGVRVKALTAPTEESKR